MASDKETEGSSNTDPIPIDPSSPYYIHASDYPRHMHVNDFHTDNNYDDWSQDMMNFWFAKNEIGFVDGTIKKPQKTDDTYKAWMLCDAMIKGWLTTAMEKAIRDNVKYAHTTLEIRNDLKEMFGKESAPRAYELKQSLTITRQERSFVSAYYTRLRILWDELSTVQPAPRCACCDCSCDKGKRMAEFIERERIYEFLMGLDSSFSTIRTQLLSMKPSTTLGEAYRLASEDEQQQNIVDMKKPHVEPSAFHMAIQNFQIGRNNQQS